uniref:Mercuric reductase n=1 Tax=Attheya septentrionalis TaxID=420275 RepID=A0A7S2XRM9_9STRA|mmetsp:Transcript_540/g.942  ORF Transcript_540/g.942 Transcript_540/m.942 type:complete len:581 (+) Transcript_540:77-1819(+)
MHYFCRFYLLFESMRLSNKLVYSCFTTNSLFSRGNQASLRPYHNFLTTMASKEQWKQSDPIQSEDARSRLDVWPLDKYNTVLLNEVHPLNYENPSDPLPLYDLVVIGAGAGGLVSSKQAARRGAKSVMISEYLAGGDCLNVGCVPSKALIRCARAITEVRRHSEFGIDLGAAAPSIQVNFPSIMERLRKLRATIAPADGHGGTTSTGVQVFQGRGRFTSSDTIEVDGKVLKFRKAVIATGGRPSLPPVKGLSDAPYTTNERLFNLETLPPRMVILGAGVIALEMAQTFQAFGTDVTVIQRSKRLFASKGGDAEAGELLQKILEEGGVTVLTETATKEVTTISTPEEGDTKTLPLMKVSVSFKDGTEKDLECECLLVATGRLPNVGDLGLEAAGVEYDEKKGVLIDDNACALGNPNVYAVGDCAAGVPRLTHMSGEMAKVVVQNALFQDDWKISSLVVPAVMYTEPEYATVGLSGEDMAAKAGVEVDVYRAGLEHNDRAILESDNVGFCKIFCLKGTGTIVGATIVAARAGEIINEVTLAMKHNIGLDGIGRNIHAYPTTGEAVMGCGLQFINSKWAKLDH